ncbi:hypothetical protein [Acidianus ambivalens]|uniref:Restriction endonuclease n=1 Tax=Acidianus ambivalens TaxID=2283 RepID=A0A6G1T7W5_ACIAM|nr:hypothetical protein [Acidianus ambivalens]MQL56589.1 hypothetical protein [Acidianus ambivalens]
MNPPLREYSVTADISLLPILEKKIIVNQEVEVRRIELKSPPNNSAWSIANNICGKSTPAMVTYTIEDAMKKRLQVPNLSKKLQYGGIYGTPDIITAEGDIIELKSTTKDNPSNSTMCRGSVQSMIYGILKVMKDEKKYGNNVHYPRLYLVVGYYRESNNITAILNKMEIYTVKIKIKGLGSPNNVMTLYKAEYIIQSLASIKNEVMPTKLIPVIM